MSRGRGTGLRRFPSGPILAVLAAGSWLMYPGRVYSQEPADPISYSVSAIGPQGVYAYAPDRWGILHLNVVNRQQTAADLLAVTSFQDEPTLQYGRRFHVPARSRMKVCHPIRLPAAAPQGGRDFAIRTMVMEVGHGREELVRSETGHLQLDGTLRAGIMPPIIGLIDSGDEEGDERMPFHLLTAMRAQARLPTRVAMLPHRLDGAGEESLNTLDQLVLADDRILEDGAGLAAIRRWVYGGGHLWVMLDRVDVRLLELLFGDDFPCAVVDRVGLTTVRIDDEDKEEWVAEFERPVDLVRVAATDVDEEFSVDGWPASLSKRFGEGRVLVTTLGARGWMRRFTADEQKRSLAERERQVESGVNSVGAPAEFALLEPMIRIAQAYARPAPVPLLPATVLEPLLHDYVGYSIPSRWLVFSLLLGFSGLLAGLGYWLLRIGRLELLGVIGPGMAVIACAGLILVGWLQRSAISSVVADLQFASAEPGVDEVRIQGVTGVYTPEPGMSQIEVKDGGLFLPDMTGLAGTTRRMVWTDADEWRWENLSEAAGMRSAVTRVSRPTAERVEAVATFGPEGLSGRLTTGEGRNPSDVIIATREGRIGVNLRPDGTFKSEPGDVLAPNEFLSADLLSDEQGRRHRVLEKLLANPDRNDYPVEPQLLFWTDPWNTGVSYGRDTRSLGAALVAVPLRLERPATGTDVVVPAPLLPMTAVRGPDGLMVSGLYDPNQRLWSAKNIPSATWLKFQIPSVLLPVEVQRLRISVQVAGPIGKLELAGHRATEAVPVKAWSDPVGTLTFETAETELFPVTGDGSLLLRVSGGNPNQLKTITSVDKLIAWKIESLSLDVHLKTVEPPR